jgi:hypothetical protein
VAWYLIRAQKRTQRNLAITPEDGVIAFTLREIGKV